MKPVYKLKYIIILLAIGYILYRMSNFKSAGCRLNTSVPTCKTYEWKKVFKMLIKLPKHCNLY